jgi:8-oxo-dGTP pyrophosphatase MutT (NUDIX family)
MPDDLPAALKAALNAQPPERVDEGDQRRAAVLIPIVGAEHPSLIFTVRTTTLSSHAGQISFPGGAVDSTDPSPQAAALREAQEEIGLQPEDVVLLGELDALPTFVSGYVIEPFVGWLESMPRLRPNPLEVAEILVVPLSDIAERIRKEAGFSHNGRSYPTEAWIWRDHVIWGATARILRLLLLRLAEAGLAERPAGDPEWVANVAPQWVKPRVREGEES